MPAEIDDILERYGSLLREVDGWFERCLGLFPGQIACRPGCSECCRGLFDITLLDALYLKRGVRQLPELLCRDVEERARARLEAVSAVDTRFREPWLLNHIPEDEWERIMPEEDATPCVLLGADGGCLAYDHRPMTCRLNGIPLIDTSGEEMFDDWCTLNFRHIDPVAAEELRHPFRGLFSRELELFRELTARLLGEPCNEIDTIIPAVPFILE